MNREKSIGRSVQAAGVEPELIGVPIQIEVVFVATDLHEHLEIAVLAPAIPSAASPHAELLKALIELRPRRKAEIRFGAMIERQDSPPECASSVR